MNYEDYMETKRLLTTTIQLLDLFRANTERTLRRYTFFRKFWVWWSVFAFIPSSIVEMLHRHWWIAAIYGGLGVVMFTFNFVMWGRAVRTCLNEKAETCKQQWEARNALAKLEQEHR